MQAALAPRGDARTYLIHFGGGGLDVERCVVETCRALACGDIVSVGADGTRPKGRSKARARILPLKAAEQLRPAREEIIIATRIKRRRPQVQYWGHRALGLFVERRQKG